MIVLADKVVAFDCDQTLVMWGENRNEPKPDRIEIIDPQDGERLQLTPHHLHIRKLKGYHRAGWFVIVWSMGGGEWAKAVSDALGITEHTSLIIGKPTVLFDDMPTGEAFGTRKYFQPKKGWE